MKKMTAEQNKRLKKLVFRTLATLLVLAAYCVAVKLIGKGIPCVFYLITDKYCPGCGISRMFTSLLRLDFVSAAKYNILVLSLLPFALSLFLYKAVIYVKTGESKMSTFEKIFYCVCFVLCIVFYFLRNSDLIPFISMK
jgi:hypothetical protein